jgi:hypothetical protein
MLRSIVALPFMMTACLSFPVSHDEVSRVPSSAGGLDAVLVETNGGATTSFGYLVYVVPHGTRPSDGTEVAMLYGAGRNDQAYGANLKWEGRSRLAVEYRDARQVELRRQTAVIGSDTVTIVLRSGVTDSAAPAGGMLYNLERSRK